MSARLPHQRSSAEFQLRLCSALDIRAASYGTVRSAEPLDYPNRRFHADGLFSQRIFGCVSDWRCECGKFTSPPSDRHENSSANRIVCDVCGVLLSDHGERRQRFGHVELATPVLHPWLWGRSHRPVEVLLGLSTRELRSIMQERRYVYLEYSWYQELQLAAVIPPSTDYPTAERAPHWRTGFGAIQHLLSEIDLATLNARLTRELNNLPPTMEPVAQRRKLSRRLKMVRRMLAEQYPAKDFLLEVVPVLPAGLRRISISPRGRVHVDVLTSRYQDLLRANNSIDPYSASEEQLHAAREKLGRLIFRIFELLPSGFPYPLARRYETPPASAPANEENVQPLDESGMVRSAQGRQRASGSPRKVTNPRPSANRRKDNSSRVRLWRPKRVDYSACSVVVPDASLRLDECGLPLDPIAWELYRPMIVRGIVRREGFPLKVAEAFVDCRGDLAFFHLTQQMQLRPCVLSFQGVRPNRKVKAFACRPVCDRAIHIHPAILGQLGLQASGTTAKVFLPLSDRAAAEAVSMQNAPDKDTNLPDFLYLHWPSSEALLGCALATRMQKGILEDEIHNSESTAWRSFGRAEEVDLAVSLGKLAWTTPIVFSLPTSMNIWMSHIAEEETPPAARVLTTAGRVLFNQLLQESIPNARFAVYINCEFNVNVFSRLRRWLLSNMRDLSLNRLVRCLNDWGGRRLTQLGLSLSLADLDVAPGREKFEAEAWKQVERYERLYTRGIISHTERYWKLLDVWTHARDQVSQDTLHTLSQQTEPNALNATLTPANPHGGNPVFTLRRLIGLTGSVTNARGAPSTTPVISSLRAGLEVREYFQLLPGQRRQWLNGRRESRVARSVARQLAFLLRDQRIVSADCQTQDGLELRATLQPWGGTPWRSLVAALTGRYAAETIHDPLTRETLVESGKPLTTASARRLEEHGRSTLRVRSPLTCAKTHGVCAVCCGSHPHASNPPGMGTAIGSLALLKLVDQLAQTSAARYFVFGRPNDEDRGELASTRKGTVSLRGLRWAREASGAPVVISRKATIEIVDWQSRILFSHEIPHGSELLVAEGEHVYPGKLLAKWIPGVSRIYANEDAVAVLQNTRPLRNIREADHPNGQRLWQVIDDGGPASPLLLLQDHWGAVRDYHYLPTLTWLHIRGGQQVAPGTLLAETAFSLGTGEYPIDARHAVAQVLRLAEPRNKAILAECGGEVEISTFDSQGVCQALIHERNKQGQPTGEIVAHKIPAYRRLLVRSRDVVQLGDPLTSGEVSHRDTLRLLGTRVVGQRLLSQILLPLLMSFHRANWLVEDWPWELVLRRLLDWGEVVSSGSTTEIPGALREYSAIQLQNAELRQCVQILDSGDSLLIPGEILPETSFDQVCQGISQIGGTLPKATRPWLAGFQPCLLSAKQSALQSNHPLLAPDRPALRTALTQAATSWQVDHAASLQLATLTGRLIHAGTGWWSRPASRRIAP